MKRSRQPWLPRFTLAVVCAALLAAPAAALAAPHGGGGGRKVKPKAPPKPQYEALTAVDLAARSVTITPMNGASRVPKTFRFNERTEVEVNGKPATVNDLRTDMMVTHTVAMDPAFVARLVLSAPPPNPPAPKKPRRP